MFKFVVAVVVLAAACGGKSKQPEAPTSTSSCDPVGAWQLKFTWQGEPGACGTDVPWDQPFTVNVTKREGVATVNEDDQASAWGSTTVKGDQMTGDAATCHFGFVAAGQSADRDINLNIDVQVNGTSASGEVELNRPALQDGGEGCSRKGTFTATRS